MSRAGDLATSSDDDDCDLSSITQNYDFLYRRKNNILDPPSPILKYTYSHQDNRKGIKMTPPLDPYPLNTTTLDLIPRLPTSPSNSASPHDDSILLSRNNRSRINNNGLSPHKQPPKDIPPLPTSTKSTKHVSISPYSMFLPPLAPIPGSPVSPNPAGDQSDFHTTYPTPRHDHHSTQPSPPNHSSIFAIDNNPLLPTVDTDLPEGVQPQVHFIQTDRCRNHNHNHNPAPSTYAGSVASSSGYTFNSAATTMMSVRHFGKFIGSALHSPPWYSMRYITTGFRINYTMADSWMSLFELHNETAGIWSHIMGFFIFVFLFLYRYNTVLYALEDRFLFWCYCAYYFGSAVCMLCSFTFHLFCCCSEPVHEMLYGLDMSAINVMIIGNIMHPVYMMWFCDKSDVGFWYAMFALIFGLVLVGVQQNSYTMQEKFFYLRIGAIIFYGASALIPFWHFHPYATGDQWEMIITPITITFSFYGVGVLIWIFKFPEVAAPGVFDLGLSSHGLWHTCILVGSLWTESGFMYILERIVDQNWCEAAVRAVGSTIPEMTPALINNTMATAAEIVVGV